MSDQGTNFRGASRLSASAIGAIDTEAMEKSFPKTKWIFNPPSSPHMGGVWERLVRSVKSNLMEVLPTRSRPTEEVLTTALTEVEMIVNSRPLTHVSIDAEDDEALTPNHLLMWSSGGIRTVGTRRADGDFLRLEHYVAQQIADKFWKRWVQDYLPMLTRRSKWIEPPARQLAVGDCVIIIDDSAPRNTWTRGRILDVNKGRDGQIRSAVVKTITGTYTRPTVKLAVLDVNPNAETKNQLGKMSEAHLQGGGVKQSPPA